MKKLGRRLRRAVKRKRAAWRRARNERQRAKHAQENVDRLHRGLHQAHERLHQLDQKFGKHPWPAEAESQRAATLNVIADDLAALERTASRAARRKHRWHLWRQRAKFRVKRETILRRKYRAARKKWRKEHQVEGYATWMLNGHSSNIDDDLKPVVAFLVVVRKQAITDTYDYCCHVSSSLHYPRNDPTSPQQGRAVDSAGPDMGGTMDATYEHFGAGKFLELFGPRTFYVKNGARYAIYPYFPGHGDHQHSGVA
jgi:hypothetical protein